MITKRCPICGRKVIVDQGKCSSEQCPYVESKGKIQEMNSEEVSGNNKEVINNGI